MSEIIMGSRFSGLDWYSEKDREVMIVGQGGIGSYLTYNLSRIGMPLYIVDFDEIDESNVKGGQLYRNKDVGKKKVNAIAEICREFGAEGEINCIDEPYTKELGMVDICIGALDNMAARKLIFEAWEEHLNKLVAEQGDTNDCLYIDGRLTAEAFDVFCIQGNNEEQIREYKEKWLFNDSEVKEMDCTTKQTSFAAMGISCFIVANLCNWLTNRKLGIDFRDVPFYTRMYLPAFNLKMENVEILEGIENV